MDTISVPNKKGPGLYEFLIEAELQHYFNGLTKSLKITHPSQLKFTTDNDLAELGMSKPEVRRLKKYYEKHFPNNYLLKFKKLLMTRKHDAFVHEPNCPTNDNLPIAKAPRVPSKHIIPASNITVNKELGMGEFGVVQQGVWSNEGERIQVAVKCLAKERMQTNTIEFLKEAAIMHSIDHPHIVRMFGVVLDTGSLMLVTELAPLRSLLECLKEPALRSSFPTLTLCDFAVQICEGMQYLEAKRLIHRDLAARNILVFSKNKVKISDFGLSRALGQGKDYYQTNFNVNLKLPIAWCAPECISYLRFTTASDVWAFGVTLWEMFSYGFQPWPALTGQQILEAIDEPNYQRLEQPDCCPQEHYALMLDCWRHEASTRPRFADIYSRLIDSRPEQVQAKTASGDGPHMLFFRIGDIITVLDKISHRPLWKGVSAAGKTGLFDPTGVVAYLGSDLPSSSFLRSDSTRTSARRKLRSEMISAPQGDLKHTGHVGLDGAYFGDLSFLGGTKSDYGGIPTQVVAPYRPHKDLESAPLLEGDHVPLPPAPSNDHEYHEISDDDDENASHSPNLDLGPSLMAEMEMMFNSLGQSPPSPADHHEGSNKSNELRERLSKPRKQATVKPISSHDQKTLDTALAMANEMTARSMSAPAPTTPVSPNKRKFSFRFPPVVVGHDHDKQPVERRNFAEEVHSTPDLQQRLRCSLSSLTDDYSTNSIRLPLWDKASAEFYFAKSRELLTKPFPKTRTPLSSHHPPQSAMHQRNSCRDLPQQLIDDDYSVENRFNDMSIRRDVYYQTHSYLTKSENLTRKTYNNNINNNGASNNRCERNSRSCLYDAPPPPSPFNRNNGESFTFSNYDRRAYERELEYEPVYSRGNPFIDAPADDNNGAVRQAATVSAAATTTASDTKSVNDVDASLRPRALSFSETPEIVPTISMKKPTKSRSIRDRNRRRQSYNPRAYVESSSSETDCASLGSVDLDWRRRKRLGRLSTSNSSIRSELLNVGGRCRVVGGAANGGAFNYLKPDYNNGGKALGRSPPPSNSVLSGLSPTTVSRCQRPNDSSTSDSSL